ncbi:Receptor-interacting serine/threonine-protein kinase 1 [Entomortierella chlamydospora]|nr:Receptor-interacting serine/threonine-protein kinase 1 [Entomortierella chlamydospora]
MPLNLPLKESSGFKIRIPRDLPNIPEVFRKRGAIRSELPLAANSSSAPGSLKRTHSTMLMDDYPRPGNYASYAIHSDGPRIKVVRRLPPAAGSIPPHLVGAKNLAIRTIKGPPTSSNINNNSSNNNNNSNSNNGPVSSRPTAVEEVEPTTPAIRSSVQKHRSQSKSKSNSPTPGRIPSPAPSKETLVVIPTSSSTYETLKNAPTTAGASSHTPGTRSGEGAAQPSTAGSGANGSVADEQDRSSLSTTIASNPELELLKPIEIMRVGLNILSKLLCNTFCKCFINKVPLTVANYYHQIKKPMDMTTLEQRLWKTLELAGANSGATDEMVMAAKFMAMDATEGFANLREFERELRRISQNAALFNSPTHVIYKEGQAFQTACTNLLDEYWQGKLDLNTPLAQEEYSPELISLSEPGHLYLFRAHTLREMERKMTDISTDLFSSFHQPIFDLSNEQIGKLSPEHPRFVRMYINKNRSVLAKSRDERFARVAILSDVQMGKPYTVSSPVVGSPTSPKPSSGSRGRVGGGAGGGSVSMVRMTAKVLIGKPIGERYDMITVGDLDCPNAWITVACVKALDLDVEVPLKFDKGILSKMRHEVVAYSSDSKIGPEYQRAFADALGLTLPPPGKNGQIYSLTGQRASIPLATQLPETGRFVPTRGLGLGITTPQAQPTPAGSTPSDQQKNGANNTKSQKSSKDTWVDLHDQGPNGRYLVKFRIPSLSRHFHQPPPISERSSVTGAAQMHPLAISTPSTPQMLPRYNVLSSQIPPSPTTLAAEMESLSAPDRIMIHEQITKRGQEMLLDLKVVAKEKNVPYARWSDIEPTLTADSAHGLFKRIYHVRGQDELVVQNFKEMDAESFDQRVREVACLLKLRNFHGVGQIQSILDNEEDHLVGLTMTKYPYTLKQYATNARQHPTPCQKLYLIHDMVTAMCDIHKAGLAHRDLSEVNIMVAVDQDDLLEDQSPKPHIKVIDFGKSVFVNPDEVKRWSVKDDIPEEELSMLPFVVLPPDHGYKLYRSILTLPRNKHDREPLAPVDPRSEDVYSLGVLIWRTFSGKSPWNGAIEDDLKKIRYLVATDDQIQFQLEREIKGPYSRELLLRCLTARAETRWTTQQLKEWLDRPEVANGLLREFEELGGGRKKVRKNLD